MSQAGFFFELSPDRVLEAVERAGVQPTGHCQPLNALENRVFGVGIEGPVRSVVAKFYRPGRWSRAQILDEHRLLAALAGAEIPCCVPHRFEDGETLHRVEGIFYAVFPRLGGRAPDELDDVEVGILGRLLARIHNVAQATGAAHRHRLQSESFARASLTLLEDGGFLPASCRARYRAAVDRVAGLYDQWSREIAFHPIHGDCHLGNLLRSEAEWQILDFDDLVVGPAVQDIWMLLPGRDEHAHRQRRLLVEAYRQFREFDARSWRLIEPLRAFRFIHYAGWIASRWQDPAFPATFPHFGTEAYWQRETEDLEELVAQIASGRTILGDEETGRARDARDEPELTNEDLFWDL